MFALAQSTSLNRDIERLLMTTTLFLGTQQPFRSLWPNLSRMLICMKKVPLNVSKTEHQKTRPCSFSEPMSTSISTPAVEATPNQTPSTETDPWADTQADMGLDDLPIPLPAPTPKDSGLTTGTGGLWR